jgi:hypothetical protein
MSALLHFMIVYGFICRIFLLPMSSNGTPSLCSKVEGGKSHLVRVALTNQKKNVVLLHLVYESNFSKIVLFG